MTPSLPSWNQLQLVLPEIWLALGMCAVLVVPFFSRRNVAAQAGVALATLILALVATLMSMANADAFLFGNMLAIDPFSQFFKVLLLVFTSLVILQWLINAKRDTAVLDTPDFLCLLLGATFGMALMASANNLLMILIATEAASLPSFALAGFRKASRTGSEGSLKYVVFGAAASAISVYGMSLIYGTTGSLGLGEIARAASGGMSPLLAVGLMALFAGIAFKLSAVPLHFWCPDVFEGAPIEVTTFLSVASKGAAICMLIRILFSFASLAGPGESFTGLMAGIAILGAATAFWGNLVALHQTNIKRLLAYSSIAHAGYMIMGASVAALASPAGLSVQNVAAAVLFYLLVYLFMNTGAFTVASLIAQRTGSEDIRDYVGLNQRSPVLARFMLLFLLSLFGMPGLGGFLGKIYLAKAMFDVGPAGFALIAALFVNTLISLWYYMRPVYFMMLVPDKQERPGWVPQAAGVGLLAVCSIALVWTGIDLKASEIINEYAVLKRPTPALVQLELPARQAAVEPVRDMESQ